MVLTPLDQNGFLHTSEEALTCNTGRDQLSRSNIPIHRLLLFQYFSRAEVIVNSFLYTLAFYLNVSESEIITTKNTIRGKINVVQESIIQNFFIY